MLWCLSRKHAFHPYTYSGEAASIETDNICWHHHQAYAGSYVSKRHQNQSTHVLKQMVQMMHAQFPFLILNTLSSFSSLVRICEPNTAAKNTVMWPIVFVISRWHILGCQPCSATKWANNKRWVPNDEAKFNVIGHLKSINVECDLMVMSVISWIGCVLEGVFICVTPGWNPHRGLNACEYCFKHY